MINIKVKKTRPDAVIPARADDGSAGYDLTVCEFDDMGDCFKVFTGISVQMPEGWYNEVFARSSLHKKGLMLFNSVGIIDNSYTGEIILMLYKTHRSAEIKKGERVCQMIPKQYVKAEFTEVEELKATERGSGGFGSSGV